MSNKSYPSDERPDNLLYTQWERESREKARTRKKRKKEKRESKKKEK